MPLSVDRNLWDKKSAILDYFRQRGAECLQEINSEYAANEFKERASELNKSLTQVRETLIATVIQKAKTEDWANETILKTILAITYYAYVVMLDLRNSVWSYDYMAFSRRVGELWEPFCRLCFEYPVNDLELFIPPLFADVKLRMTEEIESYIDELSISALQKSELRSYYQKVWSMVTSGEIKLELDLHFSQNGKHFNVDFKSGFGSNEKGNTNRLLLVATIYKNLDPNYECLLFVRADEDSNNQYFSTLKNSGVWEATCGDRTYDRILEFSGFNLKTWIATNIDWQDDLLPSTVAHLRTNGLLKYLLW